MSNVLFNAITKLQRLANETANLSYSVKDDNVSLRKQIRAMQTKINTQQRKLQMQANTIKMLATSNAFLMKKAKK